VEEEFNIDVVVDDEEEEEVDVVEGGKRWEEVEFNVELIAEVGVVDEEFSGSFDIESM
jgi:hypothetical protein